MADQHPGPVQTHGSRTAELVAVSRARHLLRHQPPYIFHDPFAYQFLSKRWKRILGSWLRDAFVSKILLRRLMPITTQPLTRARFTEDCLLAAIEDGVGQYVILGSGYDTFSLRHPGLDVTIYEIDLASTIALKRERAEAAGLKSVTGMNQGEARAYGAAGDTADGPSLQVVATPSPDGGTSVHMNWSAGS